MPNNNEQEGCGASPGALDAVEFNRLLEQVYDELRNIAHRHNLNERHNLTLQTTALVHEAWLRLIKSNGVNQPENDDHLKALTSRIIRQLLVDQARQRNSQKRTRPELFTDLLDCNLIDSRYKIKLLDLDNALETLAKSAPRLAKIVEMRFFGGFSTEQTAQALGLSASTVDRDWKKARAYLLQLLDPPDSLSLEPST